jgi:PAS domain S-box-containing protein
MSPDLKNDAVMVLNIGQASGIADDLIDLLPALVARVDCNMDVHFVNRSFRKLFPGSREDSHSSFPMLVGKQVFHQIQRHLGKILVGGAAHFGISLERQGEHRYMDVNLVPEFNENKEVKGFIFHSTDISEKLNTHYLLHDYFENASIGLHRVNADGIIEWANRAELDMLGYSEQEYIGQHISCFHKNQQTIKDILSRLSRNEVLTNYEAELICKDGSSRYVAINSSVLWEGEKFVHTRCFTIDITEQKRAEKALMESEAQFRTMANLVPLIIWTTDAEGYCNFLSKRWEELTGKDISRSLGNEWFQAIHPDDRKNIQNSWGKSLLQRKSFEAKFRIQNLKGTFVVVYAQSIPRYNAEEEFVGYIGILQDISVQENIKSSLEKIVLDRTEDLRKKNSDLKVAENSLLTKNEELEKINKELSSFAHVVSHDLQEPLRKIQTYIDRLLNIEADRFSDKGKEIIARVQGASDRMRCLIQDLLAYSRTNDVRGEGKLTNLNEIIKEVIDELDVKIDAKNAIVEWTELPIVNVVGFQFHQLFMNLISNSLKFSKINVRPHIEIKYKRLLNGRFASTTEIAQYHHITVVDNGIGFEGEYAEKIFEIFNRLHGKTEFEGTGIGLAICKKIVENHNGIIRAEGKPNEGAAFHIYLPVTEE